MDEKTPLQEAKDKIWLMEGHIQNLQDDVKRLEGINTRMTLKRQHLESIIDDLFEYFEVTPDEIEEHGWTV